MLNYIYEIRIVEQLYTLVTVKTQPSTIIQRHQYIFKMKLVTLLAVICCVNAAMSITVGYKGQFIIVITIIKHVGGKLKILTNTKLAETKKMVCYYGSWAVYRNGNGKFDVENLDPSLCTHLIFGFAGLESNNTIKVLDPYNELYDNYGKGAYLRFTGLKKVNPALKTILAIGGWNEGSTKYSKVRSIYPTCFNILHVTAIIMMILIRLDGFGCSKSRRFYRIRS